MLMIRLLEGMCSNVVHLHFDGENALKFSLEFECHFGALIPMKLELSFHTECALETV